MAFGIGYLVVTFVHTGLFLRASEENAVPAMFRFGPFNTITAGSSSWPGSRAVACSGRSGRRRSSCTGARLAYRSRRFRIRAKHFVERTAVVLIALGESVVRRDRRAGHDLTTGLT